MANNARALTESAHKLFFQGNITKSTKRYARAIKLDPNFLPAYLNLSIAYRTLSKNKLAAQTLEKAAKISPENIHIRTELGWLKFFSGQLDEAAREFSFALEIKDDHPSALIGLGKTLQELGMVQQSIRIFEKIKKLRPNFAIINHFLGQSHELSEDYDESLDSYKSALARDWTFSETRINIAEMYRQVGNEKKAWRQYSRVVSQDPRNWNARKIFKELSEIVPKEDQTPLKHDWITFSSIQPISIIGKTNTIKVGLWTNARGRPRVIKSLKFQSNRPFKVIGTRSGKVYAEGKAEEVWEAKYYRRHLSQIIAPDGKKYGPFAHGVRLKPEDSKGTFILQEITRLNGTHRMDLKGREYRGSLIVVPGRRRGIYLKNEVNIEEYLLGVLPSEMPARWPLEALKAQAIIARNQGVLRKKRTRPHRRQKYDICDSQHCQVYKGVRVENEKTHRAIEETQGMYLYAGSQLVRSFYHSNCGGFLQSAHEVPGWGRYKYLTGRVDGSPELGIPTHSPWSLNLWIKGEPPAYCNLREFGPSSEFRWLRIIPAKVMQRKINRKYRVGRLKAIIPLIRSKSGHTNGLLVRGSRRNKIFKKEYRIRYYLGITALRSTLFHVETKTDEKGRPVEFWIYGGGWGHGIGMCQSGAAGQAEREVKNYEEILSFYYPGSVIK